MDEEGPDNVTETVEIPRCTRTFEIHYAPTKAYGNTTYYDTFPSISVKVTKSKFSTKRCLTSDRSDWTKTHPSNTKLSTK
jgi:hypothetical protein